MARFLMTVGCSNVTECGFDNCYQIPADMLSGAIQNFFNVKVLHVANTTLNSQHLKKVFSKCYSICELSFSIQDPDSWIPNGFLNGLMARVLKSCLK